MARLQETFAVTRIICFLVLASFSQVFSIGWPDRELRVAAGLGFYSIISLTATVLQMHLRYSGEYHWLDLAVSASYLGTLSYWLLGFSTDREIYLK